MKMDCQQAQRLIDDLAHGRLADPLASAVHRHTTECTDCRVQQQRAARLQQLLTVKRHERPSQEYSDGFLAEFHRRQHAEATRRTVWDRLIDHLAPPAQVWRYGLAGATAVALLAGIARLGMRPDATSNLSAQDHDLVIPAPVELAKPAAPDPANTPTLVAVQLPKLPASVTSSAMAHSQPPSINGLAIMPAGGSAEPREPRYVLDRLQITPVSYDVSRTDF